MLETSNKYEFETHWKQGPRAGDAAIPELQKLSRRLGFTEQVPSTAFDAKLLDFVVQCHLAIAWYQKKIDHELGFRRLYFLTSILLLALIPLTLVLASHYQPSGGGAATTVTTQLSAIVAGILAFYRGISAWLDKRQLVAGYSKACSDLKEVLYSFEQTWDDIATDPKRAADFKAAIVVSITKCRQIVRQETDQYFANLSYPNLDLGSILKSASADAGTMVQTYGTAPRAVAVSPTPGAPNPQVASARINQLRQRVEELDKELIRVKSAGVASTDVQAATSNRDAALRDLRAAEVNQLLTTTPVASLT